MKCGISSGSELFAKSKLIIESVPSASIYKMDRPEFIVCSFRKIPLVLKGFNTSCCSTIKISALLAELFLDMTAPLSSHSIYLGEKYENIYS